MQPIITEQVFLMSQSTRAAREDTDIFLIQEKIFSTGEASSRPNLNLTLTLGQESEIAKALTNCRQSASA